MKLPNAELHTQADPAVKSSLTYTRLTGESLKKALINAKGYVEEQLPSINTLRTMLNRMGYNRKRVQKTKPLKKPAQVDEIFDNVHEVNRESDENPESLRVSIDAKAKVNIGPYHSKYNPVERCWGVLEEHWNGEILNSILFPDQF